MNAPMNFEIVETEIEGAIIKVVGVGGAGGNAVNHMVSSGVQGVEFITVNTDKQALARSLAPTSIQLGEGLGAGANAIAGRQAAEACREELKAALAGANMVFITAGMGKGTGTGASPILAEVAKELGALTVGVVTKPFGFEGAKKMRVAEEGIEALAAHTPWLESLQRQAHQLRGEIDKIEGDLNGEVSGLGTQLKLKNRDIHELGSRRFQAVRSVARQLAEQNRLLSRLKDEADKSKFELGQQEQVLGETISEQTGSIPETLDETSRQVNRLRRRIELEEKIQKLTTNQKELEREVDNVVAEQVLPVNKLTVIGIVFITGIIMAGFGLVSSLWHDKFWPTSDLLGRASGISSDLGFLLMILGTVFGFVSLGLKYHWERLAKEEMDDFRHQHSLSLGQ